MKTYLSKSKVKNIMVEKRYKLHLTNEQLDLMKRVFENHNWLCDCNEFPNCKDFKMFKKIKYRLNKLDERCIDSRFSGHKAHQELKRKYMVEGRRI